MNKDIRPPRHVLHVFEPNRICKPHDEVEFIKGRYVDIVNTKNKDPNTLYFGTSKKSDFLTGIFLGDLELTSKVKDVSLVSTNGIVTLSIKYVNPSGKLATVKTNLPSQNSIDDLKKIIENFNNNITQFNTSLNDIYDKLNIIDSSIVNINDHLTVIDTSLSFLINELDNGNYNYTIHEDPCTVENGFKKTFTLFKGNKEQENSSKIDATDMVLKQLNYIKGSNIIEAKIWPEHIQTIDLNENTFTLNDGTIIKDSTSTYENLIKTVSLDLSDYDKHVNNFINTDSSINDRLEEVKTQLKWEKIGN